MCYDARALESGPVAELELFSMLCSREIFTDQSYHACIRSEKNSSVRSDACMTADYVCDLHNIARAHNNTFFVWLIGTLGQRVAAVECVIMCVHRSCTVHDQNVCQNGTFSSTSDRPALFIVEGARPYRSTGKMTTVLSIVCTGTIDTLCCGVVHRVHLLPVDQHDY
eukprot:COSAG05_NODE_696_length_7879_cov_9.218895_5_plen_167_part_00